MGEKEVGGEITKAACKFPFAIECRRRGRPRAWGKQTMHPTLAHSLLPAWKQLKGNWGANLQ